MILLIIIIINLSNIHSKLFIKFTRNNLITKEGNKISLDEFINNRITNNYKTYILIGEPPQKLPGFLKTNTYGFLLQNTECSEKIFFDEKKSNSFKIVKDGLEKYYITSKTIQETIYLQEEYNNTDKYKKIENFEFRRVDTEASLCFHIGTKLSGDYYDTNTSLINVLKNKRYINSYKYIYKIISDDEMYFIYDLNISKENNTYQFVKPVYDFKHSPIFGLEFDKYILDNKVQSTDQIKAIFDINLGVIKASYSFYTIFKNYTKKYNLNSINENSGSYKIIFFQNDKKIKKMLKKFSISFYHRELNYNFILNYEDLFLEKKDYIYFMIIFYKSISSEWIFGFPFFKKYKFVYDYDNKLIGFNNNFKYINSNDGSNFNKNTVKIILIIVLGIIFFIGIVLITGILLGKKLFGVRKIKTNELLELYDYSSKNKEK